MDEQKETKDKINSEGDESKSLSDGEIQGREQTENTPQEANDKDVINKDSSHQDLNANTNDQEDFKINLNRAESNKLFLVSSGNSPMHEKTISFLKALNINPVLTHDESSGLKPILQMNNENKDIFFAIVLLNADDFSYNREKGSPKDAVMITNQKVVFQLGYWVGKLGREKVVALYYDQKSYRCPTEFFDVFYIPFDKNNLWQTELKEKLRNSGFKL